VKLDRWKFTAGADFNYAICVDRLANA